MKRILIYSLLILVGALPLSASDAVMDSITGRTRTIVRTDTLIRRQTIKRTEIILRTDSVLESDSLYHPGEAMVKTADPTPVTIPLPTTVTVPTPAVTPVSAPVVSVADTVASLPRKDGGEYLWVPDSMAADVALFLKGHSKVVDDERKIDNSELVTFRGDTLKMVLRDRNLGRFDRGLFNYLFIPKGIWQFGVTASYGEFETDDLEMFDLISDVDLSGHMFSVRPYVSYFIKSNMSVGLRIGYTSGKGHIGSFKVDFDDDVNFNLHDITYRSESYTAEFLFSQYFGIARRGRFGVFNEVALALASGNSDFIRPYDGELRQTHTTTTKAALNFSPGLSIFILKEVSFNVSFGVFGFTLKNEKQTENGISTGNRLTSGMNFRFNIFNINFGVSVNI